MTANDVQYRCSFCEKDENAVKKLVAGPNGVFICDQCVTLATQIMREPADPPAEPK